MALKSIRIPDDLIEFIETQPGKDFSKKLVGILNAYYDLTCSAERQHQLQDYTATVGEIERLALQLRKANRKLTDINQALEGTPAYQLTFSNDLSKIVANPMQ